MKTIWVVALAILVGFGARVALGAITVSAGNTAFSNGTFTTAIASGSDWVTVTTDGARAHLGANANAYFDCATTTCTFYNAFFKLAAGTSTSQYPAAATASVDTTARQPASCAGNVDFANPFSVPANALSATGKGVRFHFEGTAANNGNAKTIQVAWGSQVIVSKQLTVSLATENWEIEGECYKSGSNTQQCFASAKNFGGTTVNSTDGPTVLYQSATLSGTQTDTAGISLRMQETTCTATTDITQTLARISFDN